MEEVRQIIRRKVEHLKISVSMLEHLFENDFWIEWNISFCFEPKTYLQMRPKRRKRRLVDRVRKYAAFISCQDCLDIFNAMEENIASITK